MGSKPEKIIEYVEHDHSIGSLCACQEPFIEPIFPDDVNVESIPSNTPGVDSFLLSEGCNGQACHSCFVCMGWQLFVYMNWPADPNNPGEPDTNRTDKDFGDPYDNSPLVWETFKNVHDVFSDKKPTPWGTKDDNKRFIDGVDEAGRASFENLQADNTWLMDKNGKMVFYELLMNEKMFEWIYDKGVYNQQGILKAFKNKDKTKRTGISLPDWSCEIKASWMIVPDGEEDDYRLRYKLTKATVPNWDDTGVPELDVTLALIGMHINEKTPKMPNWAWFTFEHVDNCPDSIQVANNTKRPMLDINGHKIRDAHGKVMMDNSTLKNSYNLFNPNLPEDYCPNYHKPARDCPENDKYAPVQVARLDTITSIPRNINEAMHKLIRKQNANSIWQNYIMINAQWPVLPQKPDPLSTRRLPFANPRPDFVANTTMESYMQHTYSGGMATQADLNNPGMNVRGKSSCIRCHAISATTPEWDKDLPGVDRRTDFYWTDYSAVFFKAKYHKPKGKKKK
jgi:hypothetical protein